jgi:hypothetical protein
VELVRLDAASCVTEQNPAHGQLFRFLQQADDEDGAAATQMVAELLAMPPQGPKMKCLNSNGAEQPAWIGSLARANHMDLPRRASRAGRPFRRRCDRR